MCMVQIILCKKPHFLCVDQTLFMTECEVLGLISKIITGPLWRLIEKPDRHVLEMNGYYEMLLDFFYINSKDVNSFINCEVFPFDEDLTRKDKYFDCLKMQDDQIDTVAVQVAQTLFASFYKLFKVAMKDPLHGGLFYVTAKK